MSDKKHNQLEDDYNQLLEQVGNGKSSFIDFYRTHGAIRNFLESNPLPPGVKNIKLAVIGSHTLEPLTVCLDIATRLKGISPEIFQGGFNLYAQEILDPASELYKFNPDFTIISLDTETCFGEGFFHIPENNAVRKLKTADTVREELCRLTDHYLSHAPSTTLIIGNFPIPVHSPYGMVRGAGKDDPKSLVGETNRRLESYFINNPRVFVADVDGWMGDFGKRSAVDPRLKYMAGIPFSHDFCPFLSRKYAVYLGAVAGLTRKVLVLDLDNTLWGGIVGEEGLEGIELGNTPAGRAFVDFQRAILDLHKRGVILAVNSKNNSADAIKVFREHPDMVLREDAFSAMKINWEDKVTNLREIADELNLGLDSFVFIDDNPVEREYVSSLLPEVAVPDFPEDPLLLPRFINDITLFEQPVTTSEDRERSRLYRQRDQAERLRTQCDSLEYYLGGLVMKARIKETDSFSLPRVAQLFQKTNQFNLTTRRHSLAELEEYTKSPDWRLWDLELVDRFGNNGIVAAALVKFDKKNRATIIDSFLMSCRVIGRFVEDYFLSFILDVCRKAGKGKLVGLYAPTEKNIPVKEFYPRLNFKHCGEKNGVLIYELNLEGGSFSPPKWITKIDNEKDKDNK